MDATPVIQHGTAVTPLTGISALAKRGLDLVVAIPLLVLGFPLLLVVALAIRLDSPGPAIFRQRRVGRDGRLFTIYKFRSMFHRAEAWPLAGQAEQAAGTEIPIDLETFVFQSRADPRVTRVGRWLRRTSIDELPQLWNVIRGEMSLVGPRPEVPEVVALYDDAQRRRLAVKPGITGLAQVTGRGDLTVAESIRYDLRYMGQWSLALDLLILLRTIWIVLRGAGAR